MTFSLFKQAVSKINKNIFCVSYSTTLCVIYFSLINDISLIKAQPLLFT